MGLMSVVDYNGEKLKAGKLVVKNRMCSPNGGEWCWGVVHRKLSVVTLARDWLPAETYRSQGQAFCRSSSYSVTALCRTIKA